MAAEGGREALRSGGGPGSRPSPLNAAVLQADPSSDPAGGLSPLPCLVCPGDQPCTRSGAATRFPGSLRWAHALPGRGNRVTALRARRRGCS